MLGFGVGLGHDPKIPPVGRQANRDDTQPSAQFAQRAIGADPAEARWSASFPSCTPCFPPAPLIPDTSRERMFEMDGAALAVIHPFRKGIEPKPNLIATTAPMHAPRQPLSPTNQSFSPYEAGYYGDKVVVLKPRRSVSAVVVPSISTAPFDYFTRRQSAPSLQQVTSRARPRLATRPGETLVAPIRLGRPSQPLWSSSGVEIWWPATGAGGIKVHVFISSWLFANPEKLTRDFDLSQLHLQQLCAPTVAGMSPVAGNTASPCLKPGTIIPVPGDAPTYDAAPRRRFSTVSPCSPTVSSFVSGRKTYQNEFPPEAIDQEMAQHRLPILGAILTQSRRPIKQDDKVILPLPFPTAWTETVKYVITQDTMYLSEAVKGNIVNLGGKI